ncbi:ecdysteroid 22-kinase family protein, partial [Candidatus Binatia bacterium]|nr:ecdysteroid 22-kinase family protein [Candidatus Binatia bacterium]
SCALPRTAEQLAEPRVLDELLARHAPPGAPPLPRLRHARLPGVRFESSNCTNFLIEVEFATDGDADGRPLPRTLYAKLPPPHLATRAFANAMGFWEAEVLFCRRLAGRVPIETPRVFAAARSGARFVLLLENLHERPGTRLFLNRDMAAGSTGERAQRCLDAFARLHAAFWSTPADARDALLPLRLHAHLAPGARARSRALAEAAIAPSHRKAPDLFRAEHVALCRRALAQWDRLVDAWYAEPLTLLHGDSHLANCFEHPAADGPGAAIGLLDFQGVHWGQGVRDVQYHLIDSLEPDVLASCERTLVDGYVAALARHGVVVDRDRAWQQYRLLALQTLVVALVSLGLGSLTEREETVRTVLRRSVAAIERLGFDDVLARI